MNAQIPPQRALRRRSFAAASEDAAVLAARTGIPHCVGNCHNGRGAHFYIARPSNKAKVSL